MENIFKKLLGKYWIIYQGHEIAQLILKQICEHVAWVPKKHVLRKSKSMPIM